MRIQTSALCIAAFAPLLLLPHASSVAQEIAEHGTFEGGGWARFAPPVDDYPQALRERIDAEIQANIAALEAQGRLAPPIVQKRAGEKFLGPGFSWPLKTTTGRPAFPGYYISNYIDHDPNQGSLLDYNCGTRTYDLASGGHRGTDISLSPLGWQKLDNEEMTIIAAAPGTIVNKHDGEQDRTCGNLATLPTNVFNPNLVAIRHADGTLTQYLHMKNGSLTPKEIGDTVAEGEYLGTSGSSGFSSGPHTHFEVHDSANNVIDPWLGACNSIAQSYWKAQEPYTNPQLLGIFTSKSNPTTATNFSPTCDTTTNTMPTVANSYFYHPDFYFAAAETIYVVAFLRDMSLGDTIQYVLRKPDGSAFSTVNSMNTNGPFASGFFFRSFTIPASPVGTWNAEITYGGVTRSVPFQVGVAQPTAVSVIDYYNSTLKHYFRTANPDEATAVDNGGAGPGWVRTGDNFTAFVRGAIGANSLDVCRFYGSIMPGPNSHFYTAVVDECNALKALQASTPAAQPRWNYEEIAFSILIPVGGICPVQAPVPVYRLYNQRAVQGDSNHQYTTRIATYMQNIALGWSGENVVMCATGH